MLTLLSAREAALVPGISIPGAGTISSIITAEAARGMQLRADEDAAASSRLRTRWCCARKTRFLGLTLLLIALFFALHGARAVAQGNADRAPIRIAAAADLQPVLPAVLDAYRTRTGGVATASYASSATLTLQIENGAPFDLFLSADMAFPEKLLRDGFGEGAAPVPYGRGTLVLWARKDSSLGAPSLELLRHPDLRTLAIANPDHAPYGRAATAALHILGLYEQVQGKLRIAENIGQAAQFVESGNAQLGMLSLTSALTPRLQQEGRFAEVPKTRYPPILQGGLVLSHGGNKAAARAFLDFLLSPDGSRILSSHGIEPPH